MKRVVSRLRPVETKHPRYYFGTTSVKVAGLAVAVQKTAGREQLVASVEVSKFWRSLDPSPRDPNSLTRILPEVAKDSK